ncbi:MAG: DUF362 domain-containing protein [Promethearchaeota archaeon]
MAKSDVLYVDRSVYPRYSMLDKLEVLWDKLGLNKAIKEDDRVIIKTHFGAYGNLMYMRPALLRKAVDLVKAQKGWPILAESAGLGYGVGLYGGRTTAAEYFKMAAANGYTIGTMGAPIVLMDGYWGTDTFTVPIKGKHLNQVEVAMALRDADVVVVMTHFKGHGGTGMGGTLKNLGIGCVGKYSKTMMHGPQNPVVNADDCKGPECSKCVRVCPTRCITVDPKVKIDLDRCIHCIHCVSACRQAESKAITAKWGENPPAATERMIENAWGVVDGIGRDRFYYFNVALDISEWCDCMPAGPQALVPDLGIFASRDPVAVDAASMDKLNEALPIASSACGDIAPGEDKLAVATPWPDPHTGERTPTQCHLVQLDYASELGLGQKEYKLKHVDKPKPT